MKLKLLIGIVLFVVGIVTAVVGIAGVGDAPVTQAQNMADDRSGTAFRQALRNVAVPAVAGLSLAIGGLLIGLSMGNWTNPRTHLERGDEIVDPEGYHKMKHV